MTHLQSQENYLSINGDSPDQPYLRLAGPRS
jgi:hypothetical protein